MLVVRVLVVVPHEPKPWHSQRHQEEPHETQATESSNPCASHPSLHCAASRAAVSHERRRAPSTNDRRRWRRLLLGLCSLCTASPSVLTAWHGVSPAGWETVPEADGHCKHVGFRARVQCWIVLRI